MDPCPLCNGPLSVLEYKKGYRVECIDSGCLDTHLPEARRGFDEAMNDLAKFRTELDFGADMWDSKIRDRVVED